MHVAPLYRIRVRQARTRSPIPAWLWSRLCARAVVETITFFVVAGGVAFSAVKVKESQTPPALAEIATIDQSPSLLSQFVPLPEPTLLFHVAGVPGTSGTKSQAPSLSARPETEAPLAPDGSRWFNARPIRPAYTLRMRVTAYSPDFRSCGTSDDGITSTLHSVETNNYQLVAADPRVLRYGSMVSVKGYANESVVPVLDCGGKIKGNRLDLLFPTHGQARAWGSKWIDVTVWEYADGKPAGDPRRSR
jgi:3D (Asp-Asp-Asp) domain-containing protein